MTSKENDLGLKSGQTKDLPSAVRLATCNRMATISTREGVEEIARRM